MRNSLNKVKWRENYNITHLKCSHKVVRWCLQEAALSQGVACKGFIMKGFSEATPKGSRGNKRGNWSRSSKGAILPKHSLILKACYIRPASEDCRFQACRRWVMNTSSLERNLQQFGWSTTSVPCTQMLTSRLESFARGWFLWNCPSFL